MMGSSVPLALNVQLEPDRLGKLRTGAHPVGRDRTRTAESGQNKYRSALISRAALHTNKQGRDSIHCSSTMEGLVVKVGATDE